MQAISQENREVQTPRGTALGRRILTIPAYLTAWVVWFAAAPLWLPLSRQAKTVPWRPAPVNSKPRPGPS